MLPTIAEGQIGGQSIRIKAVHALSVEAFFSGLRLALGVHTVVGITGASGIAYGVRLLKALPGRTTVVVSDDGLSIAEEELGLSSADIHALADSHHGNSDLFAPLASGSSRFDAMVIAPCSASTMSKIACGIGDNLITRTASVALKEHRKLVLVIRETPLSAIHLGNMERLAAAGAVVMPACPAFYPEPKSVEDMVDFVVGRVLDVLGVENDLYGRWTGGSRAKSRSRVSRRKPR
jgi:4-hydroxy-3-polyprenylbenzoate decarboxylase